MTASTSGLWLQSTIPHTNNVDMCGLHGFRKWHSIFLQGLTYPTWHLRCGTQYIWEALFLANTKCNLIPYEWHRQFNKKIEWIKTLLIGIKPCFFNCSFISLSLHLPSFSKLPSQGWFSQKMSSRNIPRHVATREPEMSPLISCEMKYSPVSDLRVPLPSRKGENLPF